MNKSNLESLIVRHKNLKNKDKFLDAIVKIIYEHDIHLIFKNEVSKKSRGTFIKFNNKSSIQISKLYYREETAGILPTLIHELTHYAQFWNCKSSFEEPNLLFLNYQNNKYIDAEKDINIKWPLKINGFRIDVYQYFIFKLFIEDIYQEKDYLTELESFTIGYIPEAWTYLISYLKHPNYRKERLAQQIMKTCLNLNQYL